MALLGIALLGITLLGITLLGVALLRITLLRIALVGVALLRLAVMLVHGVLRLVREVTGLLLHRIEQTHRALLSRRGAPARFVDRLPAIKTRQREYAQG